jgi:tetratricopeptide (TPR) repeat protein
MRKRLVSAAIAAIVVLVLPSFVRADDQPAQTDEASALASQLSDALLRGDTAAVENLVDADALFNRLSAGVSASEEYHAAFERGFPAQVNSIMAGIVKTDGGGAYHLLRVRQVNGEAHILFRALPKGGGLNYHDWIVGKDQQGNLKLQDVYVAVSGELMSQSMHRVYVQGALAANPGLLDRLSGKDKELAANLKNLVGITQDWKKAQYQQTLDDYKKLPKSMQEDKNCMILRLMATEKLRKQLPQEYGAAMADYKRLFPGDPSVDLDCIDALFETKRFAEARQSIDRIEAFTGGDPYLLILRGNTYSLEGGNDNLLQAKQCYQKAVAEEPTLAKAYWSLVTLSLETGKYDETAALLTEIQQKLHLKIKDLTTVPAYAGFVKSDTYKKWIAAQTPGTAATPGL